LKRSIQLYRFIAVNILCIGLNVVLIKVFVEYLNFFPTVAKVGATVIIAVISYMVQTHFFFKIKEDIIHKEG
jgi:putative flippase GtrA